MLGSVARKLRTFGFDTLYIAHLDDGKILKIGIDQDRTILTADKEFFKRIVKAKAGGVLVGGSDELEDIVHILDKEGIKAVSVSGINARCSVCNGTLDGAKEEELATLPQKIVSNHDLFFKCESCGKVYWDGSHMEHIRAFAQKINERLTAWGSTAATG